MPASTRILHVVARSVPYLNGYTVRTKAIVDTQRRSGLEPTVVTSPFYPGLAAARDDEVIDGTPHVRVRHPLDEASPGADAVGRTLHRRRMAFAQRRTPLARLPAIALAGVEELMLMRRFERAIAEVATTRSIELIHVHSPYRCALPAIGAARRLGLPVVYEVRGLWEETAVAEGTLRRGSLTHRMCRRRERAAMESADAVVVISEALREDVVARGVDASRVFVSPNAVDPEVFSRLDQTTRAGAPVVGYVGSLRRLEGVDELLRGAAELRQRGTEVDVLVVGDGPTLGSLQDLADMLGLADHVTFTGQVPHERVRDMYARIDVFAVTRPSLPVTELVPPLKPLEAMALGIPVVVSGLRPLRELVRDGETGLVYAAGNPADLADTLARLIDDPALRTTLATAARKWIERERSWHTTLEVLDDAYETARGARSHQP